MTRKYTLDEFIEMAQKVRGKEHWFIGGYLQALYDYVKEQEQKRCARCGTSFTPVVRQIYCAACGEEVRREQKRRWWRENLGSGDYKTYGKS